MIQPVSPSGLAISPRADQGLPANTVFCTVIGALYAYSLDLLRYE